MSELERTNSADEHKGRAKRPIPNETKLCLLFQGLLSIGFIGYFAFRNHWAVYIFAHIGALGVAGFFGCFAGAIAKSKGYQYGRALLFGSALPLILGIIVAYLVVLPRDNGLPGTCGGTIGLLVGILVVIGYALARRRKGTQLS